MSIPRRDPFSILNKEANKWLQPEPLSNKYKIHRHKAGQVPQWELDEDDIFTEECDKKTMISLGNTSITSDKLKTKFYQQEQEREIKVLRPSRVIEQTEIIEENEEKEENQKMDKKIVEEEEQEKQQEFKVPQRKIKQEKIQLSAPLPQEISMDTEELVSRRARLKQKLLKQESAPIEPIEESIVTQRIARGQEEREETSEEEELEQDESEKVSENDSIEHRSEKEDYLDEQEQREQISVMKPVFVSREVRDTREKFIEDEIALEEERKATEQRKKQETKLFVIEAIRNKNKDEDDDNSDMEEIPDDDDNVNEKLEYESWKVRELKRIRREREESQRYEKEQKEIQRRRNLTDEQRIIENIKLGSDATELKKLKEGKTKYRFMQKFYKIGAFYMDSDDPLFKRDYNTAVGEDLRDKSTLPQCLQKRRGQVGMRGQTKYTHLTDQDTNNFDPQFKIDQNLFEKQLNKTAGYKGTNVMDRQNLKKVKL